MVSGLICRGAVLKVPLQDCPLQIKSILHYTWKQRTPLSPVERYCQHIWSLHKYSSSLPTTSILSKFHTKILELSTQRLFLRPCIGANNSRWRSTFVLHHKHCVAQGSASGTALNRWLRSRRTNEAEFILSSKPLGVSVNLWRPSTAETVIKQAHLTNTTQFDFRLN
jgi:hypothetical protein